jgi:hypothetical protein
MGVSMMMGRLRPDALASPHRIAIAGNNVYMVMVEPYGNVTYNSPTAHIPHARSKQNDILSQQIPASSNNAVSRIEPSASGLKKERDTAPKICQNQRQRPAS